MSEYYSGGGEKTVAKAVILEKYISAYLNIMTKPDNWRGPKWYVDTHSGTGFTSEYEVPIPGSVLRALDHDFDRFYFYELNGDRFQTLCDTIEDELGASFRFGELPDGQPVACIDEPYVRVMNMDCNEGVKFLVSESNPHAHWFTFVDPEQLTVDIDLFKKLLRRGKMDILYNFQTSGFVRNTADGAEHSRDKVERNLGEDYPENATADEHVQDFKESVIEDMGWKAASRKMVSEGSNPWRYDLIFASQNATGVKIMDDIMDRSLKEEVAEEIRQWRAESSLGQAGLENFYITDHEEGEPDDDGQSSLRDF